MKEEHKNSPIGRSKQKSCRSRVLIISILACVIAVGGFVRLSDHTAINLTREVIGFLKPETIINNFAQWRKLQVQGNGGNRLEVASATATENFSRKCNVEIMGRSLISKVSNISVPATYRFHIVLSGAWNVQPEGHRLVVTAPSPRPSLPVAYDTTKMEKTEGGWGKYLPLKNMCELEKSITSRLAERAGDPETLRRVREESRQSIAKFLQTWLLTEKQWNEGRFEELVVLFEGEDSDLQIPVLKVGPTLPGGDLRTNNTAYEQLASLLYDGNDPISTRIYNRLKPHADGTFSEWVMQFFKKGQDYKSKIVAWKTRLLQKEAPLFSFSDYHIPHHPGISY